MNVATIVVVSLVAAVAAAGLFFIRLGCRLSAGFWPSWSTAAKAMRLCFLASLPFTMLMPAMAHSIGAVFVFSALLLLVGAWLLGVMLKHPETGPIGIKNGGVTSLVWGFGGIVTVAVVGVVMAILIPWAGQDGGASLPSPPLSVDPATAGPAAPQPSAASTNPFTDPNYGLPPQPAAPLSDNQLTQAAAKEALTRFPYLNGSGQQEKRYLSENEMGFGSAAKAPKYLSEADMGFAPAESAKFADAAVAWRDAYRAEGMPNHLAIKHGAEMVDRYRAAGHGACFPVGGRIDQVQCR